MRSPMTPQRGHTGPCGHNTVSRYSRALSSSWKIGLRRSILLRAMTGAFQLSGDPIGRRVLRQPDNSRSIPRVPRGAREGDRVAHVGEARAVRDRALEAEAEAGMRHRAVA